MLLHATLVRMYSRGVCICSACNTDELTVDAISCSATELQERNCTEDCTEEDCTEELYRRGGACLEEELDET